VSERDVQLRFVQDERSEEEHGRDMDIDTIERLALAMQRRTRRADVGSR